MVGSKQSTKEKIVRVNLDRQIAGETLVSFEQNSVKVWSPVHRSVREVLNDALLCEELRKFNLSPSMLIIKSANLELGFIELARENQVRQSN